jgi:hypothetical protein
MQELLKEITDNDILLEVVDGRLKVFAGTKSVDPRVITLIQDKKTELIQFLLNNTREGRAESIAPAPRQEGYPLSSSQKRLWVLGQLEEASMAYHMPGVYQFEGQLEAGALGQAFQTLIERHEVLRTVFRQDEQGEVYQYVLRAEQVPFSLHEEDLRQHPDQPQEVKARIEKHLGRPFDLSAGPLLRARLYRVEDQQWVFSYVMHHIISDGWSMGILIKELLTLYQAARKGQPADLPALSIHYKDYAYWQQGQLQGAALDPHKAYWLEQFSGERRCGKPVFGQGAQRAVARVAPSRRSHPVHGTAGVRQRAVAPLLGPGGHYHRLARCR